MPFKDNEELLMSASLDATIRVWSLSQFQQLYVLSVATEGLSSIRLIEEGTKIMIASNENEGVSESSGSNITIHSLHLIIKNHLAADTEIKSIQSFFKTVDDLYEHKVQQTAAVCADNSVMIQKSTNEPYMFKVSGPDRIGAIITARCPECKISRQIINTHKRQLCPACKN